MQIYDDFLPQDECQLLKEQICFNKNFSFYLHNYVALCDEETSLWNWYGTHVFYEDGNPYYTSVGRLTDGTLLGAKSKVEVISRSELLRARGFKTEDMSYTATTQSQLPPVEITPEEDVEEETFAG